MSDEESKKTAPRFAKGDQVAIVSGRKGLGVRGEIFWIGENKYGPGVRYGIKDATGETHWVDETKVGTLEEAPPEPDQPARDAKPVLAKGTRVEITGGREGLGVTGAVFWVGESKFGQGMRYGVKADDEQTYWIDELHLEVVDTPPSPARPMTAGRAASAHPGGADEFRDFDDDAGARGYADSDAFGGDDAPAADGSPPPLDDVPFPDDDDGAYERDDADDDLPF